MKRVLLSMVIACMVVLPFVTQAEGKMVVYLTFDDISADIVKDTSGSGNAGKMDASAKIVAGQFGKAVSFAGSRVTIPASASLSANIFQTPFTVVMWINPTLTGNAWQQAFRAFRAADSSDTLFLNVNGTVSWRGRVNNAWAGGMCETAAGAVAANKWSHVAVWGDAKNFRIYINGTLSKEAAFQKTDGANVNYYLGGDPPTTGESYSGAVDDFAIFNEALKEADVVAIKNNGVGGVITSAVDPSNKSASTWAGLKSAF